MIATITQAFTNPVDPSQLFGGSTAGCYFLAGLVLGAAATAAMGTFEVGGLGGALVMSAAIHAGVLSCAL